MSGLNVTTMSMRTSKSDNEKEKPKRKGFRPGPDGDMDRGKRTCERIVCDNPVSPKYKPFCSATCKRMT